jgi:chromatin remodeling complex protein RSC6
MAKRRARRTRRAKPRRAGARRKSGLTQLMYNLSPELQDVIGEKRATRPQVVKKMWVYIKAKRLQDAKHRRIINPDARLAEVLGRRPIDMLKMAGAISKHLKKA